MKRKNVMMSVLIMVGSFLLAPALSAAVTQVKVSVSPKEYKGKCPKKFIFRGIIRSNKAGVVRYQWVRSDNAKSPVQSIRFKKPGTRTVTSSWTLGKSFKGWKAVRIYSPNKRMSNRAAFKLVCTNKVMVAQQGKLRVTKPLKPVRGLKPVIVARSCTDPSASEVKFSILSRDTSNRFKGRVRITGIVKNIGSKAFRSRPNQASAHLYEVSPGGRPVLKAKKMFYNLAPGASLSVSFIRNWYSASPAEGEFPPTYRLRIVYDPDITLDGNKDNDDCNGTNNVKELKGSAINAKFSE